MVVRARAAERGGEARSSGLSYLSGVNGRACPPALCTMRPELEIPLDEWRATLGHPRHCGCRCHSAARDHGIDEVVGWHVATLGDVAYRRPGPRLPGLGAGVAAGVVLAA